LEQYISYYSLQGQKVERIRMRNWKRYGTKLSWRTLMNNCLEGQCKTSFLVAACRDVTWTQAFRIQSRNSTYWALDKVPFVAMLCIYTFW